LLICSRRGLLMPSPPKAWVQALAAVAEECFAVQRKLLESHEARVKAAKDRPATGCAAVR
jgi:hypothetical protein